MAAAMAQFDAPAALSGTDAPHLDPHVVIVDFHPLDNAHLNDALARAA